MKYKLLYEHTVTPCPSKHWSLELSQERYVCIESIFLNNFYTLSNVLSQREQMEPILNFQVPAEGLELVILLHTQY